MGVLDRSDVKAEGAYYGWYEHDYQWSQGELEILRKNDAVRLDLPTSASPHPCYPPTARYYSPNPVKPLSCVKPLSQNGDQMQLNIWCTTGTVGSYLNHPRQGKTQLFRRNISGLNDLRDILLNPRVHTGEGYHRRQQAQPSARTVPCPGCGRMYKFMSSVAGHFESGACQGCPGRENAQRAAYGFVRQQEQRSGHAGMMTGNTQQLLTFNSSGQADYTAGYVQGGENYECPGCRRTFRTLQGLISHSEAKPQCRGHFPGGGNLQLTFR